MEVRRATEDYRRMSFAVTYWRPAPGPVMRVVSNARKAGVPMSDLRLVVLNLDLRVSGEAVVVRPQRLVRFLSGAAFAVVLSHWTLLCALAVTSGAPPWLKLVLVAVISLIYVVLYRGWSIYTSRPLKTIERCGARLTEICLAANGGELRQLPQRPVDWKPK